MNSKLSSNQEKILFEYKYATRMSVVLIGMFIFGGAGIFLIHQSWQEKQILLGVLGLLSFSGCFLGFYGARGNKNVKVYEDRIEIPKGPFSKIINTFQLSDIQGVNEFSQNGIPIIQVLIRNKWIAILANSHMADKDFYELLDYLEKIPKKPTDRMSPFEADKIIRKVKAYKWIGILLPVAFIIGGGLFTGGLKTIDDWKLIAVILCVLFGIDFLLAKAQASRAKQPKGGKTLLSKLETKKLKNKWELIVYSPALLSLAAIPFILKIPHEGTTSIWPFISYGLAATVIIMLLLNLILPEVEEVVSKGEKYLSYGLSGILTSFVSVFCLICLNINLDRSISIKKTSYFTERFSPKGNTGESCFRIAHWVTGEGIAAGDAAYCDYTYPSIKEKDEVGFLLHDGFLGVPWLSDVKILKYQTLETYMSSLGSDLKLRFLDVEYMAKLHGKTIWKPYLDVWEKDCKNHDPSKCRLASYALVIDGKGEESRALLRTGCNRKDFFTCYNYFVYPEFSKSDLKVAKLNILEHCKEIDDSTKKVICDFVKDYEVK